MGKSISAKLKKFGEKMSDIISTYMASWSFIGWFLGLSAIYMIYNVYSVKKFDPVPFILLNLIYAVVASLSAPLIMQSTASADRKKAKKQEEDLKLDRETNEIVKQILKELKEGKDVE